MNIKTLRQKLTDGRIIWVTSANADGNGRFIPENNDGVNHTLVYIPKVGMLHVDSGDNEVAKVKMSEKQYRNLFAKHGYKTQ